MSEEDASPVLEIRGLQKDYRGLRPLRIQSLSVRRGEIVGLVGFDDVTAELFVNLATGATVPDAGECRVLGELSTAIADADAWLHSLDRFGLLSQRAVLLDALTVRQNLAMPFTLDLDPLPQQVHERVVALANEVGLQSDDLERPASDLPPFERALMGLARAIALEPQLLLAEHPNASVPSGVVSRLAGAISGVIARRGMTAVVLTADPAFASELRGRVLTLSPATGELRERSGWRGWLNR